MPGWEAIVSVLKYLKPGLPLYIAGVGAFGFVLFAPSDWAQWLGFADLRSQYRPWVSLPFIGLVSLALSTGVPLVVEPAWARYSLWRAGRRLRKTVLSFSEEERAILALCQSTEDRRHIGPIQSEPHQALVDRQILNMEGPQPRNDASHYLIDVDFWFSIKHLRKDIRESLDPNSKAVQSLIKSIQEAGRRYTSPWA